LPTEVRRFRSEVDQRVAVGVDEHATAGCGDETAARG